MWPPRSEPGFTMILIFPRSALSLKLGPDRTEKTSFDGSKVSGHCCGDLFGARPNMSLNTVTQLTPLLHFRPFTYNMKLNVCNISHESWNADNRRIVLLTNSDAVTDSGVTMSIEPLAECAGRLIPACRIIIRCLCIEERIPLSSSQLGLTPVPGPDVVTMNRNII